MKYRIYRDGELIGSGDTETDPPVETHEEWVEIVWVDAE